MTGDRQFPVATWAPIPGFPAAMVPYAAEGRRRWTLAGPQAEAAALEPAWTWALKSMKSSIFCAIWACSGVTAAWAAGAARRSRARSHSVKEPKR